MENTRKKFLKQLLVGASAVPVVLNACSKKESNDTKEESGGCKVSPEETDGPYPLYNSRGSSIQRIDITDGKTGITLNITINILNTNNNCNPLPNARVDIWHCDKDGYYSGYSNRGYLGNQDNTALVFCRGLQYAEANGQVKFKSIYPGWYEGRVTHIHAQVYVDSKLKKTTQIAFPDEINTAVYKTSLYSAHGQNTGVPSNKADSIIGDSLAAELATVTANDAGGYDLVHNIYVAG
ncbi:intradiol ring-cleavage dioxygenase [Chitinophaga silvatica]|uniref:Intradiol ring-cleavage dioxygenase n=1 Tax=Chitinophaga silvatica TaxID=2282649 RepID=A0A3E1Y6P9_9BACT|nr:intradiol ring-cleavage dioxygenase [Chitinophaga silvatica]RFS20610.1 intradiol ring-cleavage dioxygenase [Chitinophaga silvatica]